MFKDYYIYTVTSFDFFFTMHVTLDSDYYFFSLKIQIIIEKFALKYKISGLERTQELRLLPV